MINIQEKKDHYVSSFGDTDWTFIHEYLQSSKFDDIIIKLVEQVEQGNRFTPKYKDMFNSFLACPYKDVNVIFVGQDPYPQLDVADGISFSCSKTNKEQPSLRYIFNELQRQYPNATRDCELSRWSKQGVLMLNTALTVQVGKIGSHYSIWRDFSHYLCKELNKRSDLITVLLGKKAEEFEIILKDTQILKVPHPAAAAYKGGVWDSKNLFIKINEMLEAQNKSTIQW